jgi:hypothetical protein
MTRVDCHTLDENLMDFLYEELDSDRMGEVRAHVDGCARCSAEVSRFQATRHAVSALEQLEPPQALTAKLLHQAAAQRRPLLRRSRAARWAFGGGSLALAAAATCLVALQMRKSPLMEPPSARDLAKTPAPAAPAGTAEVPPLPVPEVLAGVPEDKKEKERATVADPGGPGVAPRGPQHAGRYDLAPPTEAAKALERDKHAEGTTYSDRGARITEDGSQRAAPVVRWKSATPTVLGKVEPAPPESPRSAPAPAKKMSKADEPLLDDATTSRPSRAAAPPASAPSSGAPQGGDWGRSHGAEKQRAPSPPPAGERSPGLGGKGGKATPAPSDATAYRREVQAGGGQGTWQGNQASPQGSLPAPAAAPPAGAVGGAANANPRSVATGTQGWLKAPAPAAKPLSPDNSRFAQNAPPPSGQQANDYRQAEQATSTPRAANRGAQAKTESAPQQPQAEEGQAANSTADEELRANLDNIGAEQRRKDRDQAFGSGDNLYRELQNHRGNDCTRVFQLVDQLAALNYGQRNPQAMKDAYQLRARCQTDQAQAQKDLDSARKLGNEVDRRSRASEERKAKSKARPSRSTNSDNNNTRK